MCVHAAKVSQASWKGAGQVSQVFKCVVVSPDNISCAWPRVCTGWCCRTPCHLSQSCETGDGGDSQQIIQTIPTSTSATLIMILTMHRSEDLMRDVHGERHDVAGAPPRGPCTRKQTSSKVDFLNFHTKRVADAKPSYRPNYLPAKTSNQLPTKHSKLNYLESLETAW